MSSRRNRGSECSDQFYAAPNMVRLYCDLEVIFHLCFTLIFRSNFKKPVYPLSVEWSHLLEREIPPCAALGF